MNRITGLLLSTALLAAGPAAAQYFTEWDGDADGLLTEDEWGVGARDAGLYSTWDADADGALTSDEFGVGLFSTFDDNDDGSLSVDEWDEGIDSWYGEQAVNLSFENWDADGDGMLSEAEFAAGFETEGGYNDFATEAGVTDAEAGLNEDQFLGGMFSWLDDDDDASLNEEEANGWF